jgi:hypothetical protein
MSGYVPPSLQPLIGHDLDALSAESMAQLIGMAESQTLDVKQETYGNSDSDKRELALDVCAFANRDGGLLVIGMAEDDAGNATALLPMSAELAGAEELRVTQIVSQRASPVPQFRVRRVAVDGGEVIAIAVPPSARRPHAVMVNNDLRYALREGTHKRYLTESEIADLYRSRFREAQADIDVFRRRHDQAREEWAEDISSARLIVSLQPLNRGSFEVTRTSIESLGSFYYEAELIEIYWSAAHHTYVRRSLGSLRISDKDIGVYAREGVLWTDGGGSLATKLPWHPDSVRSALIEQDLVATLLNSLRGLTTWGVDHCGASGDALVRVELGPTPEGPIQLYSTLGNFPGFVEDSTLFFGNHDPIEMTVSLETLRADPIDLVAIARELASHVLSVVGFIGPRQISREDKLRIRYFAQDRRERIKQWAASEGVEVTDDVVLE